jgi:hypothetical protein
MANGGDWGGTKVDEAFDEFLQELVGSPALNRFHDDDKAGHLDLLREQYFSYIMAVSFIDRLPGENHQVIDKLYHTMLYRVHPA